MENMQRLMILTSEALNSQLKPSIIEKDFYVTKAIHAIRTLRDPFFKMVFSGGTALSKGYHLIHRMSEDIDFKFILAEGVGNLTGASLRNKSRLLRRDIINILRLDGFVVQDSNVEVMHAGKAFKILLDYPSVYPRPYSLRAQILTEFTYDEMKGPINSLTIASLISETLSVDDGVGRKTVDCVSVLETAAEKWTAITRRISGAERGYVSKDKSIIRHLYDLYRIERAALIQEDISLLIEKVILRDRINFKNQYPEYWEDPFKEIDWSIKILLEDLNWKKNYDLFLGDMVYEESPPNYSESLDVLCRIRKFLKG